jgi:hypothetical protein
MQIRLVFPCVREAKVLLHLPRWIYVRNRPGGNTRSNEPVVEDENDESILDAFNLELDDVSPMNSAKYEEALKEYDEELAAVDQPPAAQQVFATMTELAGEVTTNPPPNPEVEQEAGQEDEVMDEARRNNPPPPQTQFRCSKTCYHPEPYVPLHHFAVILADTENSWPRPSRYIV